MKSQTIFVAAVASMASQAFAWPANCANNCANKWNDWSQGSTLCKNTTAIDDFNSCIGSSSCSDSDKNSAYQAIAQICANNGVTITAAPEATFSVTSGGSAYPSAWSSWANANGGNGVGAAGWTPGNGKGPFGGQSPWGGFGSSGAWTNGPWTSWWGGSVCPPSSWSGWTSGPWSTNAPWTSWTACTATTTASSVYTTTFAGNTPGVATPVVSTGTSYGIKVAQATSSSSASSNGNTSGAGKITLAIGSVFAAFFATLMAM
ncbi:hypothetical protein IWZ01DRAFT_290713 [Phyllosticta capitalensis]